MQLAFDETRFKSLKMTKIMSTIALGWALIVLQALIVTFSNMKDADNQDAEPVAGTTE